MKLLFLEINNLSLYPGSTESVKCLLNYTKRHKGVAVKLLFIGLLSLAWISAYGGVISENEIQERIYINAEQVSIEHDGIFVWHEEAIISVTNLNYDQNGLYFNVAEMELPKAWICRVSGRDNNFWNDRCLDCNHRKNPY
jgi:hypothetical protein